MKCQKCNIEHNGSFGSGKYCSRSCANSRVHSYKTKNKIKDSLLGKGNKNIVKKCEICFIEMNLPFKRRTRRFCSKRCAGKYKAFIDKDKFRKLGILAANKRALRSKNEIYFYELCLNHFKNVTHNEQFFNNWDADIIIHSLKIAILWNGIWHYKKVCSSHSLKQVQSRDKIKIKEIIKYGYTPYIIKDVGKYSKSFVEQEFNTFLTSIPSDS